MMNILRSLTYCILFSTLLGCGSSKESKEQATSSEQEEVTISCLAAYVPQNEM